MVHEKFVELDDASVSTTPQKRNADPANIHFENISYAVTVVGEGKKFWERQTKEVLKNVSGDFQSNKLTAVIGSAGCGKTTLLDIISGYRSKGVSGYVYVNGAERNVKKFIKKCCYVMQEDALESLVTVEEAMNFAANMKLAANVSKEEKTKTILEILEDVSLETRLDSSTQNLTRSEQRRLTIALELISNPPVLFLDEPTRGLDWQSSKIYFATLRKLTSQDRAIVCTIREPSMATLNLFHNIYWLWQGRCIYQGTLENLIPYLAQIQCPVNNSPIEYVTESFFIDGRNYADELERIVQSGKSQECLDTPSCWHTIPLNTLKYNTRCIEAEEKFQYTISWYHQIYLLLNQMLLVSFRNMMLSQCTFAISIVAAFLLGIFFYDVANSGSRIVRQSYLFFLWLVLVMFYAIIYAIITCKLWELAVRKREHFNRWYSLNTYFIASAACEIPAQVFIVTAFNTIVYYMTGQPTQMDVIIQYFSTIVLFSLIVHFYGKLVAILLNADVKRRVAYGLLSTVPWVVCSHFFIRNHDVRPIFQWIFEVSAFRRAFEAVVATAFYRKPIPCLQTTCDFESSKNILEEMGISCENLAVDFLSLLAILVILNIFYYVALRRKLSRKK